MNQKDEHAFKGKEGKGPEGIVVIDENLVFDGDARLLLK
jgi:hypothetical protein